MRTIRKAEDRGTVDLGWLQSRHSFSFGDYHDPDHMGFETLRVINDDDIAPTKGFGMHPHRNMEIVSYILDGALEHRDSLGNGSVIKAGEFQRMSAGSGIKHSEFNPLDDQTTRLLQIWFLPEKQHIKPSYEQKAFAPDEKTDTLKLAVSPDGTNGSLRIHQDINIYVSVLTGEKDLTHTLQNGRGAWIQVARGTLTVNGDPLKEGDGIAICDENIILSNADHAEILLFDMKQKDKTA